MTIVNTTSNDCNSHLDNLVHKKAETHSRKMFFNFVSSILKVRESTSTIMRMIGSLLHGGNTFQALVGRPNWTNMSSNA